MFFLFEVAVLRCRTSCSLGKIPRNTRKRRKKRKKSQEHQERNAETPKHGVTAPKAQLDCSTRSGPQEPTAALETRVTVFNRMEKLLRVQNISIGNEKLVAKVA